MKVLHIGKYYPPFMGGIEKVNYDIVEGLNEDSDFQVDELCFAHSTSFVDTYVNDKYKLFRLPIIGIKFSTPISKKFFSTYKRIRNEYDVIHIHMPNPIVSLAPLIYPTRAKIVLHWHCDIVKKNQQFFKKFYNPFQNLLLKKAISIIGTSENYAFYSKDLKKFHNKLSIVPIGIDNSYLIQDKERIREIKETYKGKKIVFSLGRLSYYKGFKFLIEAAKYLNEDTVVLIGGCGEQEQELKDLVSKLDLTEKVKFLGRVSDKDMGSYYGAADVFCLPSPIRTEAFGVVLLEAMSLGVPIVACKIPGSGVSWVNKDNVTGFNVPIEDPKSMAEAITKIITDDSLNQSFRKNAFDRYKSLFTSDKMIESIKYIYKNINH